MLYPLKFKPIFKSKLWGGNKIKMLLGKDFSPLPNCGEDWEISAVAGNVSEVMNGFLAGNPLDELVEVYMGDLVGEKVYTKSGLEFPLLVKFIDAGEPLSVQVHPDDKMAFRKAKASGKTECWYVLDADEGAGLYVGFRENTTKAEYLKAVASGSVEDILKFYPVKKGDAFYIPAGTVHAIGAGVLLAEIQQSSDITYRIYDWNRKDEKGVLRELHPEEALEAIHFESNDTYKLDFEEIENTTNAVLRSSYFNLNLLSFDRPMEKIYIEIDSFIIYICLEGEVHFRYDDQAETVKKGEVILIPAMFSEITLLPVQHSKVLECYI